MDNLRKPGAFLGRYVLSLLITIAVTLVLFRLRPALSTTTVALIYLLPVLASTTRWGLGPGVASALAAFLAYNYFFLKPYYTLRVHSAEDLVALMIFLFIATLTSQLVGNAKTGLAAARMREHQATRLYELSTMLTSANQPTQIAQVVATQTLETFQADYVELYVANQQEIDSILFRTPLAGSKPLRHPEIVIPMQTGRGLIGELRFWKVESLSIPDDRLLRTFTSQCTLALERSALTHAETRARVLEQSDQIKSALLSSVSHDLRTPLSTIKAASTSLLSGEVAWDSPARQELLSVIDEESDHLNYLVGNLLAMSRIEAGALQPNRQWNVLSEIINSALVRMRHAVAGHHIEVNVSDDLPLVQVDYVQLELVFTNLIQNSVKYAPLGTTIDIQADYLQDNQVIEVEVSNQGPPVAPEHLERIFDKFYRVTDAERITGTGLGLSICKGIIEAHGGKIWAGNEEQGFTFHFTLPVANPTMPAPDMEL